MSFFTDCKTVEEIKIRYRALARQHHPDLGGNEETMKAVNNAYESALKGCDGQTSQGTDGKPHTYRYNQEREKEIMDAIQSLLGLKMSDVNIDLIGLWVWVTGDTKPHKDELKKLGCRWHSKRGCWYWKPEGLGGGWRSSGSLDDLASKYGCERFKEEPQQGRKSKRIAS